MRDYKINTESTLQLAARLRAERAEREAAGLPEPVNLFRQVMPEPEGRAAYDAYDRMYGQG